MIDISIDPFKIDKDLENKINGKYNFVNPRHIAMMKYRQLSFLYSNNRDDWRFSMATATAKNYWTCNRTDIYTWTNILRGLATRFKNIPAIRFKKEKYDIELDPDYNLYSITERAILHAKNMYDNEEVNMHTDIDKKTFREGFYKIIKEHEKFIYLSIDVRPSKYTKNFTDTYNIFKNFTDTDNIFKIDTVLDKYIWKTFRRLYGFFPDWEYNIIGYIINVSGIYYSELHHPVEEGERHPEDEFEYGILKSIEGENITNIPYTYYDFESISDFENSFEESKSKRRNVLSKFRHNTM